MTPPYSVHTTPADTTHAKASAAKRLRSNGLVFTKQDQSLGGNWEVDFRFARQPLVIGSKRSAIE
jgi:hypothetical protein